MSQPRIAVGPVLLALVLTGGCGARSPEVAPHGLEAGPLVAAPEGGAIEMYGDVRSGAWRVDVTKHWIESRAGGPGREGKARLALSLETRVEAGEIRSVLEVSVLEASGLAARFVAGFDGLQVSLAHAPDGRPDPATLRFDSQAPPQARSFVRGLWLAGLAGATPWFPRGELRVGSAWPRERLGEDTQVLGIGVAGEERPRLSGGGRVVALQEVDGEQILEIQLDGLVEHDATRTNEALSVGKRDTGRALVRARDGLPLEWTYTEEYRLRHVRHGIRKTVDIKLEVEAKTTAVETPLPSDPDDR